MTQAMQVPSLMTSTSSKSSLLSQDAFKAGIKVIMSEWRPKPGQLLQMARQMTPRQEHERKQRQAAQQAERKAHGEAANSEQLIRNWPKVMEEEKAMSFAVRRAILSHLRIGYKKPEHIKIVLDTIDLMTIEKAMVLAYEDPVAEAITVATKLYETRKEAMVSGEEKVL